MVSPSQSSAILAPLQEIILKGTKLSPIQTILGITDWDPLTQPINNTCSDPSYRYEFSSKVTQTLIEQQAKVQPRNETSHIYGWIYVVKIRLWSFKP